jgi:hypothetical protein
MDAIANSRWLIKLSLVCGRWIMQRGGDVGCLTLNRQPTHAVRICHGRGHSRNGPMRGGGG